MAIARKLGYRANRTAVNLLQRRAGMIALTSSAPEGMPTGLMQLDFFVRFVNGATIAALDRGYAVVLAPPAGAESFDAVDVDGGIVIDPLAHDPLLQTLATWGVPAVTSGRDPSRPSDEGSWVDNDIAGSTHALLDHIRAAGAETIGLVSAPAFYSYGLDYRHGYEQWCADRDVDPQIVEATSGISELAGFEAATAMLQPPRRPDAIFAALDRYALGALAAARSHGLTVPGDVMLAAGTDSELTRTSDPPITAIDLHPEVNGRRAVELLIAHIEDTEAPDEQIVVPANLAARASTRA